MWVSAHPDVIQKMATKQVLVDTAGMSWSAETHLYASLDQLRAELPGRLARDPLVLKQQRGMGGEGVWKVQLEEAELVRVQHAASGSRPELIGLADFVGSCEPYFADGGVMVEQPFQPRIDEGMIRVYLNHDQVVGFAHQGFASSHLGRGLRPRGERRLRAHRDQCQLDLCLSQARDADRRQGGTRPHRGRPRIR